MSWPNNTTCERKPAPTVGEGPCIGSSTIGGMKRAQVSRVDPGQHSRDKWKAATHVWVLESECASQAGMLSGHAQRSASARCWASWQVGAWGAAAEQSHLHGHTTPYKKYYKFTTAPMSERPRVVSRGLPVPVSHTSSLLVEIHAQKVIEENRHGDEKSGRLKGTSGSASDD
ncbi:hypothetical protein B0H10DRAFT_1946446 [Mycena sp. CBHHK59/15]|nr:hypothetical protein B0H10DRAFT_1946446 [Mycena sp. CBHHK59/15]